MDGLQEALAQAREIAVGIALQPTRPESSIHWLYLSSAFVIALAVYLAGDGRGRASVLGFLRWLFPGRIYLHRSARHDLGIFVINTLIHSFVLLGPLVAASSASAHGAWQGLHSWLGPVEHPLSGTGWQLAMTVAILVVGDLAFFVSHRLQHRIGWLWEFHKVHHSAEVMNPLTVFRRHPIDVAIERGLSGVMLGGAFGVFAYLSGDQLEALSILGVNAAMFLFLAAGFNLQHSHVWVGWGPVLGRIFVSPASHQIHHSKALRHLDKNFGNVFAFWDWASGSLYLPREREQLELGLGGDEERDYASLLSLYFAPFAKLYRRLRARPRPAAAVPDPAPLGSDRG